MDPAILADLASPNNSCSCKFNRASSSSRNKLAREGWLVVELELHSHLTRYYLQSATWAWQDLCDHKWPSNKSTLKWFVSSRFLMIGNKKNKSN